MFLFLGKKGEMEDYMKFGMDKVIKDLGKHTQWWTGWDKSKNILFGWVGGVALQWLYY